MDITDSRPGQCIDCTLPSPRHPVDSTQPLVRANAWIVLIGMYAGAKKNGNDADGYSRPGQCMDNTDPRPRQCVVITHLRPRQCMDSTHPRPGQCMDSNHPGPGRCMDSIYRRLFAVIVFRAVSAPSRCVCVLFRFRAATPRRFRAVPPRPN